MSSRPTIGARAVAQANVALTAEACVAALDKVNETSMIAGGTSTNLQFPGCSLYVNSPSPVGLNMNGGAVLHPNIAYIAGSGYSGGGLTTENGVKLNVSPLIDPYRNVAVPTFSGCNDNNYKLVAGKTGTKNVGSSGVYVFCKGIELEGSSSLTLGPGTFIIDQGLLKIAGNATLTASGGTTIILTTTGGDPSKCATAAISGGAIVTLKAPNSGSLSGIAIYQDRSRCNLHTLSNNLNGGATQNITGAIYFPEQTVSYAGNSPTGGPQCTQLIAWMISFSGGSTFQNNCADVGTRKLQLTGGQLVE
jgi:hypothetical protein